MLVVPPDCVGELVDVGADEGGDELVEVEGAPDGVVELDVVPAPLPEALLPEPEDELEEDELELGELLPGELPVGELALEGELVVGVPPLRALSIEVTAETALEIWLAVLGCPADELVRDEVNIDCAALVGAVEDVALPGDAGALGALGWVAGEVDRAPAVVPVEVGVLGWLPGEVDRAPTMAPVEVSPPDDPLGDGAAVEGVLPLAAVPLELGPPPEELLLLDEELEPDEELLDVGELPLEGLVEVDGEVLLEDVGVDVGELEVGEVTLPAPRRTTSPLHRWPPD